MLDLVLHVREHLSMDAQISYNRISVSSINKTQRSNPIEKCYSAALFAHGSDSLIDSGSTFKTEIGERGRA